jgi:hypothetical protein
MNRVLLRLAALAATLLFALPASASVDNDAAATSAYSSTSTKMALCGGDEALIKADACKDTDYAQQATELEQNLKDINAAKADAGFTTPSFDKRGEWHR